MTSYKIHSFQNGEVRPRLTRVCRKASHPFDRALTISIRRQLQGSGGARLRGQTIDWNSEWKWVGTRSRPRVLRTVQSDPSRLVRLKLLCTNTMSKSKWSHLKPWRSSSTFSRYLR